MKDGLTLGHWKFPMTAGSGFNSILCQKYVKIILTMLKSFFNCWYEDQ